MDCYTRYGLEFNPFLKNSKEILLETEEYHEAIYRLDYLLSTKGFGLLTGSPGKGKTTIVRNWSKQLNPSLYKVIYTCFSTFSANDFYRNLASELGAEPAYKKPDNFKRIQEEINRLALEKRKTPVIIIDEANYINAAILNDFKLLFNFEMDSRDRAVVLLAGLPKINTTLTQQTIDFKRNSCYNKDVEGTEGRHKIVNVLSPVRSGVASKTNRKRTFSL